MSTDDDITLFFLEQEKLRKLVHDAIAADRHLLTSNILPCPSCEGLMPLLVEPQRISYECDHCGFYGDYGRKP